MIFCDWVMGKHAPDAHTLLTRCFADECANFVLPQSHMIPDLVVIVGTGTQSVNCYSGILGDAHGLSTLCWRERDLSWCHEVRSVIQMAGCSGLPFLYWACQSCIFVVQQILWGNLLERQVPLGGIIRRPSMDTFEMRGSHGHCGGM